MLCFNFVHKSLLFFLRLFILLFVLNPSFLPAQDIIILQNGSEVKGKVTELGLTQIKYLGNRDSLSNEILSLKKEDVFVIFFKNGQKRFISTQENSILNPTDESFTLEGSSIFKNGHALYENQLEEILGPNYLKEIQKAREQQKIGKIAIVASSSVILISGLAALIADLTYESELGNLKNYYVLGQTWFNSSGYSIGANMSDLKTSAQFINACVPILAMGGITITTGVFLHFKGACRLRNIVKNYNNTLSPLNR